MLVRFLKIFLKIFRKKQKQCLNFISLCCNDTNKYLNNKHYFTNAFNNFISDVFNLVRTKWTMQTPLVNFFEDLPVFLKENYEIR